jgi:diguanylate cyclase (GGDEF)-like protein/PAS domain S-box-containing protein
MGTHPRHVGLFVFAALITSAVVLLGILGWPQPNRVLEFSGLIVAAVLTSVLAVQRPEASDRGMMPLAFVIHFASLLLFGPHVAMLVIAAGVAAHLLADSPGTRPLDRTLVNATTTLVAIQLAGLVHGMFGGTRGHFVWPWQGLPIGFAVATYALAHSALTEIVVPLVTGRPINRWWPSSVIRDCPHHMIGAGLAIGLIEIIDHQLWEFLPVAALPLFFAHRAYCSHVSQIEYEHRSLEAIESLDQGIAVVDGRGFVTLWNHALEYMVNCSRDHALGRTLLESVPVLQNSGLQRTIDDAIAHQSARSQLLFGVLSAAGARILQVTILPADGSTTLLWRDVTDQKRAEYAVKRSEERLALAAEGASDGLWEWDLRSQEFYVSARWRAMIGLPASEAIGRLEDWTDRVHPDEITPLREALQAHLSGKTAHFQYEHRIRHESGTYRLFLCRGVAVRGAGKRAIRIAGSLTDTTGRSLAREWVLSAGFLDPLTGLSNRSVFVEKLGRRLEELKQRGGERFAALYIDLDRFKIVNDSLGHLVGDALLIAVSRRLESCLRPNDALARLGGDEFAILLNELGDEPQANAIAFRIQHALSAPFSIGGKEVFTSASIGIAFGRRQYDNPEEIMRDADTAMYHAKARGKARHELFDADMHARVRDRLGLENDLRHAVGSRNRALSERSESNGPALSERSESNGPALSERSESNGFEIHYQPIVSLSTGMCVGFEALVRWKRNGETIPPATFVPIAEELGLIEPLGTWVLQQACRTFADWQRRFGPSGLECITVNVSNRQLMEQNFLLIVEEAVDGAGLAPCDLRLEITETALMDSPHVVAEVLRELRDFGVKIYLDDFGTGYSSLSHLHKLPVDALKIDHSFVKSLLLPDRPAIVESILALARTLNTSVVAEGIESDVQARALEQLGCTHAQGFLFSRPLTVEDVEGVLRANQPLGPKRGPPALVAAPEHDRDRSRQPARLDWP